MISTPTTRTTPTTEAPGEAATAQEPTGAVPPVAGSPCPTYPSGPARMPHRKNAAEWVMYVALLPLAWAVRILRPSSVRK